MAPNKNLHRVLHIDRSIGPPGALARRGKDVIRIGASVSTLAAGNASWAAGAGILRTWKSRRLILGTRSKLWHERAQNRVTLLRGGWSADLAAFRA